MRALLTSRQSQELDSSVQKRFRLSADLLMEHAASLMYCRLANFYDTKLFCGGQPVSGSIWLALCGSGSNGGDALALVRQALFAGLQTAYVVVPDTLSDIARARLSEVQIAGGQVLHPDDPGLGDYIAQAHLILDGLAGSGGKAEARYYAALIQLNRQIRDSKPKSTPVVSIDLPSGIAALPTDAFAAAGTGSPQGETVSLDWPPAWYKPFQADLTLCIEPAKAELYFPGNRPFAGVILPVAGVFPYNSAAGSQMALLSHQDFGSLNQAPSPDAHKGQRGALGVQAGSIGAAGAALLCSRAAQAAGAGTVSLMLRDEIYPLLANTCGGLIIRPVSAGAGRDLSAMLIGPGLGLDSHAEQAVMAAWHANFPLVLDADALRLLGKPTPRSQPTADGSFPTVDSVLLPHPGEFCHLVRVAGLCCASDQVIKARAAFETPDLLLAVAKAYNSIVVLKNSLTWLGHPDGSLWVYEGREAALGTGGAGDVLAGIIAGLLARGFDAWRAAALGVLVHGYCGKAAAARTGFFDPEVLIAMAATCFYHGRLEQPGF